jgi:hypothetical protein
VPPPTLAGASGDDTMEGAPGDHIHNGGADTDTCTDTEGVNTFTLCNP